jgi:hypothetical protein
MGNALAVLDQGAPALPAEIAAQLDEASNLPERASVPSLSYKGKVWSIHMNGEETKLQGRNSEGDLVPLPVMRVIVLDWAKERGRAYYTGAYDPEKASMPDCWSDDGVAPSANVKSPQSTACKTCPMAAKGSKVTDNGKELTACQLHRMIAVVPAAKPLEFPPLRLKLAITSDYDGQSPDHEANGWYAFRGYTDQLKARGVKHTALLVTKMMFDPNVAYPKVLFAPDKWVAPDVVQSLMPTILGPEVKALITGSWTPNGVDGQPVAALPASEPVAAAPPAAPAKAPAATAPTPVAAAPKAPPKAAAKPKAPPPPPADEEIVEEEFLAPGSPEPVKPVAAKPVAAKPKPEPEPVSETQEGDAGLEDLLSEWDA